MIATAAMLALLEDVAERLVLPRFGHLAGDEVATKAHARDFVTVADREAEVELTRHLTAAYPDALVLGEEATTADAGLLDAARTAAHVFTVDPVDGTRNFVDASPDFGVMVAEVCGGIVVRSWIWQPVHRRGYVAERGGGVVRVDGAGTSALPAIVAPEDRAAWIVHAGDRPALDATLELRVPSTSPSGACAVDYPGIAEGAVTAVHYRHAMPWDHAPGSLLLTELGGAVLDTEGSAYDVRARHPGLVSAASSHVGEAVRAAL